MSEQAIPTEGTVERWAWDYVTGTSLELKLSPPPPPSTWSEALRRWLLERPGRPPELVQ